MESNSAPDAAGAACPVLATAQIVSGKWTLLILRDLGEGPRRFSQLERSLCGISPRTLSIRLRALEEEGILERRVFAEMPPRVEYRLTLKGSALAPIVEAMRVYGARWLADDCAGGQANGRVLEAVGS
jgi:DNA-binding HxlR family transcriptional regulator